MKDMKASLVVTILALAVVIIVGYAAWRSPATTTPLPVATPESLLYATPSPAATVEPITALPFESYDQVVQVTLKTSLGDIELELDGASAPVTVGNFLDLARKDFYDSSTFHRVIPGFMIQGGDPLSKDATQRARHGTGGPGYTFPDEFNEKPIVRGSLAMANSGPNTNGSQFFIVVAEATPYLDGRHTNFGKVVRGMDVVDAIVAAPRDANDNPLTPVVLEDVLVTDEPR
jgi:cyclophilin family peptidyl-prolyl cis-trans isomerase